MCLAALQAWPDDLGEVVAKVLRRIFPLPFLKRTVLGENAC
jgi:hypothetical protein